MLTENSRVYLLFRIFMILKYFKILVKNKNLMKETKHKVYTTGLFIYFCWLFMWIFLGIVATVDSL